LGPLEPQGVAKTIVAKSVPSANGMPHGQSMLMAAAEPTAPTWMIVTACVLAVTPAFMFFGYFLLKRDELRARFVQLRIPKHPPEKKRDDEQSQPNEDDTQEGLGRT
jgi:hypothetical protein